ncbi:MAG: FtsB family cell division protein [Bryobacteraceae bacterium]
MKSSLSKFAGAVALVLVAFYAFIALQGPQGIPGLMEKQRQIKEYEKKNADKVREIEEQRARIGRLNDGKTPENEIRERLQLVKPGEKVFMLQDGQPAQPAPAPRQ